MKLISIIIPIYNVANYIRACLESVFQQGLNESDFEVILINDGSKDNSMEVIAEIIEKHSNISVIEQENQGLSVARNNGLIRAKGQYVLMIDSDDLLVKNSLSVLLSKAIETYADMVIADFVVMTDAQIQESTAISQGPINMIEKTGEKLFLEDLNPHNCYVWHILFRRDFLLTNQLFFQPGIIYEDVPFTHECFLKAKSGIKSSIILNIYRKRIGSETYSFDINKAYDYCKSIAKTWQLTHIDGLSPNIKRKLREDIYTSFYSLMYSSVFAIKDNSASLEILKYLYQLEPELRFTNNLKQKIITLLLKISPRLYIYYLYAKSI